MPFLRAIVVALVLSVSPAFAQQQEHQHQDAASSGWEWSVEGSAFLVYNYQYRRFTNFDEIESQNWLMTSAHKSFGDSSLQLIGMFSAEPFTLRDIGSPQVFQTGETFNGAPLIDYQHPHDLIMNLGGELSHGIGQTTVTVAAYVVGPAPIGPINFMHRALGDGKPAGAVVASLSRFFSHHTGRDRGWRRAIGIPPRGGRVSRAGAG